MSVSVASLPFLCTVGIPEVISMHLEEIEKGQRGRGKEGNEKMTANKKERGLSETRNGKLTGREEEKEKDENCTGLCVSFSLVIFPDRFFSLCSQNQTIQKDMEKG